MNLSPDERADFADWLWAAGAESRENVKASWDAQVTRRVAEMEASETQWIAAEKVLAKIHRKIRRSKT